jgi:hypothetical protein
MEYQDEDLKEFHEGVLFRKKHPIDREKGV